MEQIFQVILKFVLLSFKCQMCLLSNVLCLLFYVRLSVPPQYLKRSPSRQKVQWQRWHRELLKKGIIQPAVSWWEAFVCWQEWSFLLFLVFVKSVPSLMIFVLRGFNVKFFPVGTRIWKGFVRTTIFFTRRILAFKFEFPTSPEENCRQVICIKVYMKIKTRWMLCNCVFVVVKCQPEIVLAFKNLDSYFSKLRVPF